MSKSFPKSNNFFERKLNPQVKNERSNTNKRVDKKNTKNQIESKREANKNIYKENTQKVEENKEEVIKDNKTKVEEKIDTSKKSSSKVVKAVKEVKKKNKNIRKTMDDIIITFTEVNKSDCVNKRYSRKWVCTIFDNLSSLETIFFVIKEIKMNQNKPDSLSRFVVDMCLPFKMLSLTDPLNEGYYLSSVEDAYNFLKGFVSTNIDSLNSLPRVSQEFNSLIEELKDKSRSFGYKSLKRFKSNMPSIELNVGAVTYNIKTIYEREIYSKIVTIDKKNVNE